MPDRPDWSEWILHKNTNEDSIQLSINGQWSLIKSNYGKIKDLDDTKISGYNVADNVSRKMRNVGETIGQGSNVNVKAYSSKTGQLSAKQQANQLAREQNKINRKQPVKIFTPEQIAEENKKRKIA